MGTKDLIPFLKKRCPKIIREIPLSELRGMKLSCDTFNYLYKYKSVTQAISRTRGIPKSFLEFFISLIICLYDNGIDIIFIFDGKAPDAKKGTQISRRERKEKARKKINLYSEAILLLQKKNPDTDRVKKLLEESTGKTIESDLDIPPVTELAKKVESLENQIINISPDDIKNLKDMLESLGVPWVEADGEAEQLCAQLAKEEITNACLSSDSDLLPHGCPFYIKDIDTRRNTCKEVELEDVLGVLDFDSQDQFIDFCILCGTDYNDRMRGKGPVASHKLIKEYHNLEGIEKKLGAEVTDILNFREVRKLFNLKNRTITPLRLARSDSDKYKFIQLMRDNNIRLSHEIFSKLRL